jgi:hypothetical protein
MSPWHVAGFFVLILLLCHMWWLWIIDHAPLVDEHEQPIEPQDMPRDLPISRERFGQ